MVAFCTLLANNNLYAIAINIILGREQEKGKGQQEELRKTGASIDYDFQSV